MRKPALAKSEIVGSCKLPEGRPTRSWRVWSGIRPQVFMRACRRWQAQRVRRRGLRFGLLPELEQPVVGDAPGTQDFEPLVEARSVDGGEAFLLNFAPGLREGLRGGGVHLDAVGGDVLIQEA